MRQVYRKWAFIWLSAGWLSSAVFANYLFGSGIVSSPLLFEAMLEGFHGLEAEKTEQILRVVLSRIGQTALVWAWSRPAKGRCLFMLLFLAGLLAGSCLALMTWQLGVPGLIWFFVSLLPHMPFYLASWVLLVLTGYRRRGKLAFIVAATLAGMGILLEVCAGPYVWRWIPGFAS